MRSGQSRTAAGRSRSKGVWEGRAVHAHSQRLMVRSYLWASVKRHTPRQRIVWLRGQLSLRKSGQTLTSELRRGLGDCLGTTPRVLIGWVWRFFTGNSTLSGDRWYRSGLVHSIDAVESGGLEEKRCPTAEVAGQAPCRHQAPLVMRDVCEDLPETGTPRERGLHELLIEVGFPLASWHILALGMVSRRQGLSLAETG